MRDSNVLQADGPTSQLLVVYKLNPMGLNPSDGKVVVTASVLSGALKKWSKRRDR